MNTTSRRREQVIGLALPVAILVISLAVMFWALSDLPDPVAVHWGPAGTPDAFGSPLLAFILLPVTVLDVYKRQVPAHRVEDGAAAHAVEARDEVHVRVAEHVTDVQAARGGGRGRVDGEHAVGPGGGRGIPIEPVGAVAVSYTHLDVYKRQGG